MLCVVAGHQKSHSFEISNTSLLRTLHSRRTLDEGWLQTLGAASLSRTRSSSLASVGSMTSISSSSAARRLGDLRALQEEAALVLARGDRSLFFDVAVRAMEISDAIADQRGSLVPESSWVWLRTAFVETSLAEAGAALRSGNVDKALSLLDPAAFHAGHRWIPAVQKRDLLLQCHSLLAVAHRVKGNSAEALMYAEKARAGEVKMRTPRDPAGTMINLAACLSMCGRHMEALAELRKATELLTEMVKMLEGTSGTRAETLVEVYATLIVAMQNTSVEQRYLYMTAESDTTLTKTVRICWAKLGPRHPLTEKVESAFCEAMNNPDACVALRSGLDPTIPVPIIYDQHTGVGHVALGYDSKGFRNSGRSGAGSDPAGSGGGGGGGGGGGPSSLGKLVGLMEKVQGVVTASVGRQRTMSVSMERNWRDSMLFSFVLRNVEIEPIVLPRAEGEDSEAFETDGVLCPVEPYGAEAGVRLAPFRSSHQRGGLASMLSTALSGTAAVPELEKLAVAAPRLPLASLRARFSNRQTTSVVLEEEVSRWALPPITTEPSLLPIDLNFTATAKLCQPSKIMEALTMVEEMEPLHEDVGLLTVPFRDLGMATKVKSYLLEANGRDVPSLFITQSVGQHRGTVVSGGISISIKAITSVFSFSKPSPIALWGLDGKDLKYSLSLGSRTTAPIADPEAAAALEEKQHQEEPTFDTSPLLARSLMGRRAKRRGSVLHHNFSLL